MLSRIQGFRSISWWTSTMAYWRKMLAIKSNHLNSVLTHMIEERTESSHLSSDYTCMVWHYTPTHIYIHRLNKQM